VENLDEAREAAERAKEKAVEVLRECGNHRPILMAFTPPGQQDVVMDAGQIPPTQRWPLLRTALVQVGAVGYVYIDEAWVHAPRPDEIRQIAGEEPGQGLTLRKPGVPRPSEHPDRREALLVHWQFKIPGHDEWAGVWQQMFRHEGEAIEMEEATEMTGFNGRAARLLDPVEPDDDDLVLPDSGVDKS
jgi:hypothetical protein